MPISRSRMIVTYASIGVLGGLALIAAEVVKITVLFGFIAWAAVVIAGAICLHYQHVEPFRTRVFLSFASFLLASMIFYGWIVAENIRDREAWGSVLGHLWRIGFLIGIGLVIAVAVAVVAGIGLHAASAREQTI